MALSPLILSIAASFKLCADDFHLLTDDFLRPIDNHQSGQALMPRIDVKQLATAFYLKMALPSINQDEVELPVCEGVLDISMTRKPENIALNNKALLQQELREGCYVQKIVLGKNIDDKDMHASFEEGMLFITAPKLRA